MQQAAPVEKIAKETRHCQSSLQTTPCSRRSQVRTYRSRCTSFRQPRLLFKSTTIGEPCNQVDPASDHTRPPPYPKSRSHMDPPSDLILPPGHLCCLLLVFRLHWLVVCLPSLSPKTTRGRAFDKTVAAVSGVIDRVEAMY